MAGSAASCAPECGALGERLYFDEDRILATCWREKDRVDDLYQGPRLASRQALAASQAVWAASLGERRGAGAMRLSDELDRWLRSDCDKTLGGLIDMFEERSFAVLFLFLLGPSALPLPTGGVTQVLEVIAMLLALQLIANRDCVWLPRRWRAVEIGGEKQARFLTGLMTMVRRLERVSRPRLTIAFEHRISNVVFGALVIAGSLGAFLAVPFTGLDTLPALGVVLVSLGVLLKDFAVAIAGTVALLAGVVLELVLGRAAVEGLESLL
jgi:hypothetical protein